MDKVKMVREVPGFEPKLTKIKNRNGEDTLYLLVADRKDWFFRWCEANNKSGVLDDSEYVINESAKLVIVTATVYVDGVCVAKSSACRVYDPANPDANATPIQEAGTSALGRALANFGFSSANCAPEPEELKVLADAPVAFEQFETSNNPMLAMVKNATAQSSTTEDTSNETAKQQSGAASTDNSKSAQPASTTKRPAAKKSASTQTVETGDVAPVKTVEEAFKIVLPVTAKKGNTLGLLWNTTGDKSLIYYLAGQGKSQFLGADKYPNLVHACKLIIGLV